MVKNKKCHGPTWCIMCKKDGELVNHLFVQCPYEKEIWNEAIKLTLLESKFTKKIEIETFGV